MIVTIDFRLFPESKSKNFQNVLFDNCCIGNDRMLLEVVKLDIDAKIIKEWAVCLA